MSTTPSTTTTGPDVGASASTRYETIDTSRPGVPMTRLVTVELRKLVNTRAGLWLVLSMAIISAIITTAMMTTTIPKRFPTRSSSFWSGVVSAGDSFNIPAMRPISVCIPVAVTTALPRP